ncbi:MAG TPA: hypothetical protein VFO41_17790 [Alphaproteobacteria bacterium]|nr:hypothetical protein [Alphaproteobacteria bacterium]
MFTKEDLKVLMTADAAPAISIFLPTHVAGPDIMQDPIRLKNLLADAEARLVEKKGMRRPDAVEILKAGHLLVDDPDFWRHQSTGLAVFLAPGISRVHRVPLEFDEALFVGDRFQVKPLLPLLADDGRFFVLTISLSQVRLFEGSKFRLDQRRPDELPKNVAEVVGETEFENAVHFHTTGPAETTGGVPSAKFHAAGESDKDLFQQETMEFLRRVATAVDEYLTPEAAPLVVAAEERWLGHFRELCKYRWLVEDGIATNPDVLSEDELHRRAYAIMEPRFAEKRAKAVDHYNSLAYEGNERAPHEVAAIVPHAQFGRVDVLFVAQDVVSWGRFDEAAARAETHEDRQDGDEDLLDRAAVQTLLAGGSVYALPHGDMPSGTPAAAILRY